MELSNSGCLTQSCFYLVFCAVKKEVNIEREGGGDGEGEVRDHCDHVHPGGP